MEGLLMNYPKVAIIGSGPSGCYAAEFMRKKWSFAEISIFESLPVPYGQIRYGIAADHQEEKAVMRQFDRLFERENVNFIGNVTIGKDVTYQELQQNFDVVIQSTGFFQDKKLSIPIAADGCVIGAVNLLRLINGCPISKIPIFSNSHGSIGTKIAIIGAGNVTLDLIRLLSKKNEDLLGSDVNDEVLNVIKKQTIRTIHIVNRGDVDKIKFDLTLLKELSDLSYVSIRLSGTNLENSEILKMIDSNKNKSNISTEIIFHFNCIPSKILKFDDMTILHTVDAKKNGGSNFPVDTVITAIGIEKCNFDYEVKGYYCPPDISFIQHQPLGSLTENRQKTLNFINQLIDDFENTNKKTMKLGFNAIKEKMTNKVVDYTSWKCIEAYERISAPPDRCRKKITSIPYMLKIVEMMNYRFCEK
ncbi:hypothetical protein FM020_06280 [Acinetobacter tandoii]|nr:hypothetical protein FM020_06280 [Acinetobacter tandoii]